MRLLSRASRAILVQSVASTIPNYMMQATYLPKSTKEKLEKMSRVSGGRTGLINDPCIMFPGTRFVYQNGVEAWASGVWSTPTYWLWPGYVGGWCLNRIIFGVKYCSPNMEALGSTRFPLQGESFPYLEVH